jgi:hypothetical protein
LYPSYPACSGLGGLGTSIMAPVPLVDRPVRLTLGEYGPGRGKSQWGRRLEAAPQSGTRTQVGRSRPVGVGPSVVGEGNPRSEQLDTD